MSDPHGEKPLGRVSKVNPDGTAVIEWDMSNPAAVEIVAAGLMGGPDAANAVLQRQQRAGRN